jgi:hypothetical protein
VSSSDTAEGRTFGEAITITVEETGAAVTVRTRYPEKKWTFMGSGHISFSVDYDILMPESAPLLARDKFGDVSVEGLRAAGEIANANGRVFFRDGAGAQKIENAFGPVDVQRNVGDLTVNNSNGAVTVSDVEGAVDVRDRFGSVTVQKIRRKRPSVCQQRRPLADVTGLRSRLVQRVSADGRGALRVERRTASGSGESAARCACAAPSARWTSRVSRETPRSTTPTPASRSPTSPDPPRSTGRSGRSGCRGWRRARGSRPRTGASRSPTWEGRCS